MAAQETRCGWFKVLLGVGAHGEVIQKILLCLCLQSSFFKHMTPQCLSIGSSIIVSSLSIQLYKNRKQLE